MSQESKSLRAIPSGDEDIPSMLEVATQAIKIVSRMKKHAETCPCCKEVLDNNATV